MLKVEKTLVLNKNESTLIRRVKNILRNNIGFKQYNTADFKGKLNGKRLKEGKITSVVKCYFQSYYYPPYILKKKELNPNCMKTANLS